MYFKLDINNLRPYYSSDYITNELRKSLARYGYLFEEESELKDFLIDNVTIVGDGEQTDFVIFAGSDKAKILLSLKEKGFSLIKILNTCE
jgi:hypothetical protein